MNRSDLRSQAIAQNDDDDDDHHASLVTMDPNARTSSQRRYRIALVCDFFFPRLGGVEMHVWSIAQQLLLQNHYVCVITRAYNDRVGVRIMTNSLRVYYLPFPAFADDNSFFAVFHSIPLMRVSDCSPLRGRVQPIIRC